MTLKEHIAHLFSSIKKRIQGGEEKRYRSYMVNIVQGPHGRTPNKETVGHYTRQETLALLNNGLDIKFVVTPEGKRLETNEEMVNYFGL